MWNWYRRWRARLWWRREAAKTHVAIDQVFEAQRRLRQDARRSEILRRQAEVIIEGIRHERRRP